MKNSKCDRKIKAILFDLDGVLINSFNFWFHLFNDTLEHFGHKRISIKVFRQQWGKSTEEDIKNFMPERTVREIKSYFYSWMHKFTNYLKINPDAKMVLHRLSNNYKLGCVSNSHTKIMRWQIESSGLKKYFRVILSADKVKRPKPAPDMLLKACGKLKALSCETIFVGDTTTDLIAGKNAGCIVIGYKIKSILQINHLKEFLNAIKNLKQRRKNES